MINMKLILFSVLCGLVGLAAAGSIWVYPNDTLGTIDQKWGFVEVRPGAQIFWWLYKTAASKVATEKPLILYLAGGPGVSASYYSNFDEIGPLDVNLRLRTNSWISYANVLFVDSPVGVGFSSVKSDDLYATTDDQIAEDLVNVLRGFYEAVPDFKNVPVYIFSNSYGAKTAVKAALIIHEAVQNKNLTINFKGVGLGSSWISPIDNILSMPVYLYQLGYLDTLQFEQLINEAEKLQNLTVANNWTESFAAYSDLIANTTLLSGGANIYNILEPKRYNFNTTSEILTLMDKVKTALKLNETWKGVYTFKAYMSMAGDFMKPVTNLVERLLNETDISVAVYNGEFDSGTSILAATSWLNDLNFKGSENYWNSTKKETIIINGITEGFKMGTGKLSFYTVLRAGHYVEKDNPRAMKYILEQVTDNFKV